MNKVILACLAALFFLSSAWAHDPGLSGSIGKLQDNTLELTLGFAVRDAEQLAPFDKNSEGVVTAASFQRGEDRLSKAVSSHCEVKFDGKVAQPETVVCRQDDAKNVSVHLSFSKPSASQLSIDFSIIHLMPFGHRMFFSLSDSNGKTLNEQLLTAETTSVSVPLTSESSTSPEKQPNTLLDFIEMGITHILTGYDHLLFLFGLLLVTRTFRSAFTVISAFTVAHSITLALSTLNIVVIPSSIIEPCIAATIIYVGLENLWQKGDPHKRWILTFSFGLIHGCGFASALRVVGVRQRAGGVLAPLFGFNLGVEIGQLTIAAIILPIIWMLRTKENFLRYGVPACSLLILLAGSFWFIQRVWFS